MPAAVRIVLVSCDCAMKRRLLASVYAAAATAQSFELNVFPRPYQFGFSAVIAVRSAAMPASACVSEIFMSFALMTSTENQPPAALAVIVTGEAAPAAVKFFDVTALSAVTMPAAHNASVGAPLDVNVTF